MSNIQESGLVCGDTLLYHRQSAINLRIQLSVTREQTCELIRQLFQGRLELGQLLGCISFHVLKCLINLNHALLLLLDLAGKLVNLNLQLGEALLYFHEAIESVRNVECSENLMDFGIDVF